MSDTPRPVYLVHASDPGLVSQALTRLIDRLAGDAGPGALEEHGEPGRDEPVLLGPVLDACRTPPFLTARRVVVLRSGQGLDAAQVKEVAAYLADPLASSVLVLALSGKSPSAALLKAVRAAGEVVEAEPSGNARARSGWFADQLKNADVRLDAAAAARLAAHLGEDLSRLAGICAALTSAYGPGARISLLELEPFLGTAGGIAPWDLTEALDHGDIPAALAALGRLSGAGGRHALEVLGVLRRHYGAMLRLDGAGAADDKAAAALTGLHPFPARKALEQSRRLGHRGVTRAIALLAAADLDLRGRRGWPNDVVMEVLVARLAQLSRRSAPRSARAAR